MEKSRPKRQQGATLVPSSTSSTKNLPRESTGSISPFEHADIPVQTQPESALKAKSAKRKVQWADEAGSRVADDPQESTAADQDDSFVKDAPTYVDDKGMLRPLALVDSALGSSDFAQNPVEKQYLAAEIYNPIEYGDFRSYMKHKRAKLKIQEASLLEEESALLRVGTDSKKDLAEPSQTELEAVSETRSEALKGCCVYINGQTHPPYSELRRLLVLHGGDLMAYMDQKTPVTHIVASNLTPKKRIEFKDYKVVLPGWILESIELGKRADWRKWRCDASTGSNGHTSDSMVSKPMSDASDNRVGNGQWRNLTHAARMPRPVPRFGEEEESPWGKPSNQTNLLQKFTAAKPTKQESMTSASASNDKVSNPVSVAQSRFGNHSYNRMPESDSFAGVAHPPSALKHSNQKPTGSRAVRFSEMEASDTISQNMSRPSPEQDTNQNPTVSNEPLGPPHSDEKLSSKSTTLLNPETPERPVAISNRSFYASCPSNTHAARLLASPSWRERNTATSEGFLAGYFAKSRLHHLSTWKTSLQDMVSSALREAGRPLGSSDLPKGVDRVIFHIDFDSFFVAVGLKSRPDLVNKAVVVCHGTGTGLPPANPGDEHRPADNQSSSTSEIASCSYKAREFGIRNGMSLGQAKRLCPTIETIPYNFEAYNSISLTFYAFLLEHSDALQAVSVDEALVDVSLLLQTMRSGKGAFGSVFDRYRNHIGSQGIGWTEEKQLAEAFRDEIRHRCGCEASIGIGSNILIARLATRKAKPGGSFHLLDEAKQPFLNQLNVDDLHGIGWSLRNRIRELFDTINIGELLSRTSENKLIAEFGPKKGKTIWDKMHGFDADRIEGAKLRQSVGSHVNYGIRFLTVQEAETFVDGMCQEVSQRARAIKLRGKLVSVQIMVRAKDAPFEAPKFLGHGVCDTHHRSVPVKGPGGVAIDDGARIKAAAWPLIRDLKADPKELRGIAISLNKLEPAESNHLSPLKAQTGQSVLNFGKSSASVITGEHVPPLDQTIAASSESDEAEELQLDEVSRLSSLEKGRDAATPRKPYESVARAVTPPPTARDLHLPSPTQLMLPSRSQIDAEVLAALPTQYRQQVETKYGTSVLPDMRNTGLMDVNATPSSSGSNSLRNSQEHASQNRLRVLPRSTPTTPQKAKLAPTPEQAEALMLPSASQIDMSVLAELPASIRKEIERQTWSNQGRRSESASSSTTSTPTKAQSKSEAATLSMFLRKDVKRGDKRSHVPRSLSESPSKKRMINKLLNGTAGASRAGSYLAPDQPIVDRDTLLAINPSQIGIKELESLGIDPEVFSELPLDLQRETFRHHAEQRKSEKARFKAGKTKSFEELSAAETRRRATVRAAQVELLGQRQLEQRVLGNSGIKRSATKVVEEVKEKDAKRYPPLFLVAQPRRRKPCQSSVIFDPTPRVGANLPSIRGLTALGDVKELIDKWVMAFATQGPREGDVDRIASYLAQLVRSSKLHIEDMAKVTTIVGWIQHKVESAPPHSAREKWQDALRSITNQVQSVSRDYFAGADIFLPQPAPIQIHE